MAATSTYSDEDPFFDCDKLEEEEAVIDDDQHTHQIELATLATCFTKSQSISSKFDFCNNGNRGLRSVL